MLWFPRPLALYMDVWGHGAMFEKHKAEESPGLGF